MLFRSFSNQDGAIVTAGVDLYISATLNQWELYAGYTFTDARRHYLPGNPFLELTPKHRAASVIGKKFSEKWFAGLEGSYNGSQYRDGDTPTPGYLLLAALLRYNLSNHITLVLNAENMLNYRQSAVEPLYSGTISNPVFKIGRAHV